MEGFRNIFREVSTTIIVGVVVNIILAAGLGVWARFMKLDGLYIALIVIGVLGVTMMFINQFGAFFQGSKKPLYQQPSHYIDGTLRDWLYKGGFSVGNNKKEGFEFLFLAKDKQGRKVLIGKPNGIDEIVLELIWVLMPNETAKLQKLEPELQRTLVSELRISLARHLVAYSGLTMPITKVIVEDMLILDNSFTRYMFLDSVDKVRYAAVLLSEVLNPILERETETETPPRIKVDG